MPIQTVDIVLDAEPPGKTVPREKLAEVTRVRQKGDRWCWVACLVSVMPYDDTTYAQRNLVREISRCRYQGCYNATIDPECDVARDPDTICALWQDRKSQDVKCKARPFDAQEVYEEISDERPIHVVYARHAIMVDGWRVGTYKTTEVHVMDPQDLSREWVGSAVLADYPEGGCCEYTLHNIELNDD